MAKEKVTLTLDAAKLAKLRTLVGARSLSSTVDAAIDAELARRRHFAAVDAWLLELDKKYGAVSDETMTWASGVFDDWTRARSRRKKAG
jgi:hypothetical protein